MTGPEPHPETPRNPGRRRALTVLAGLACLPLAGGGPSARSEAHRWTGTALGAKAEMIFAHVQAETAQAAAGACATEVERLEKVFSLWRGESELSRLNREGVLTAPSLDLREVLERALDLAEASGGAFDPTVQPLWQAYADAAAHGQLTPSGLPQHDLAEARALVDWRGVRLAAGRVSLARPGMAVTLNGIAQGYITGRIAALLHRRGFRRVLVRLGETYALGTPAGEPGWRLGVRVPGESAPMASCTLADRALCVSAGAGSPFEPSGRNHHLLDPESGRSANRFAAVAVEHPDAMTADGLSTALTLLSPSQGRALLRDFGGAARYKLADGGLLEA